MEVPGVHPFSLVGPRHSSNDYRKKKINSKQNLDLEKYNYSSYKHGVDV